ncbi:DUF2169 domain-containing protein [Pseudomonas sp. D47]|uniref:DUF2169 family type VI secretion system accessory protein n=1 Tax=Pseudomonas sp. D47 TaxID=3159447 RepID=UPI00387B79A2
MHLTYPDISLLTLARQQGPRPASLTITVGLLYDRDHPVIAAEHALPWLSERFAKQPFDSGLKKARGSFAVHGSAYPLTSEQQQQGMAVRVRVASISKILHLHPPRTWQRGVAGVMPRTTGPLLPLPLDLHHAFGGAGWADNPDGSGYVADPDSCVGTSLPQIEDALSPMRVPGQTLPIATLGPLPPHCLERREWWGTCDAQWTARRAPYPPLDCDARWFDAVPQDQCAPGYWSGNEDWCVEGMHPQHPQVSGTLPALRVRLFVKRTALAHEVEEPTVHLDTVWLFPDVERVLLLYRAEVSVADLDGADIAQLGALYECAGAPCATVAACCEKLWPCVKPTAAAIPTARETVDKEAIIRRMQASIDARYATFAAEQGEVLECAANLGKRFGKTLNRADYPATAPDLAALMPHPAAKTPAFDPVALKARIHTAIEHAHAAAEKFLDQTARRLNMHPEALRQQIKHAEQSASPALKIDPLSSLDYLSLSPQHKASLHTQLSAGLQQMRETEQHIKQTMHALRAKLPGAIPGANPLRNAPPPTAHGDHIIPKAEPWTRALLEAAHTRGEHLEGAHFVDLDLSSSDLAGATLQRCVFDRCVLTGAQWLGADLTGSILRHCDLRHINLRDAQLAKSRFNACLLDHAQLGGASLQSAAWSAVKGQDIDLTNAKAADLQLDLDCQLPGIRLDHADLANASLQGASLVGASLRGCDLQNALLHQCDLRSSHGYRLCARNADFTGSNLSHIQWVGANLQQARLRKVRLEQADLRDSNLHAVASEGARGLGARLQGAVLSYCRLPEELNNV